MFRDRKAIEAACYLLEKLGGSTEYIKLIKLLYLADRKLLEKRGRTITGDEIYALPHGPILSMTLDRLKGRDDGWKAHLGNPEAYRVALTSPVEIAALSTADEGALGEVFAEHGDKTWKELVDFTHTLPEWIEKKIGGHRTRVTIHLSDVARALGYSPEAITRIEAIEEERQDIASFMKSLGAEPVYA